MSVFCPRGLRYDDTDDGCLCTVRRGLTRGCRFEKRETKLEGYGAGMQCCFRCLLCHRNLEALLDRTMIL